MARQKGSANFAGTLEVLAGGPLDARSQVPTKADLTVASNFPYPYVGMQVYVIAEGKRYTLKAADVTVLANWEVEGGGTGGGHTIEDSEGTALTQRDTLQFGGDLEVSDDDENEKTMVAPHELTAAELAEIMSTLPGQPTQGITIDLRGNEQVVGKVIESDGTEKPLYQKTILETVPSSLTNRTWSIPHGISNLDIVVGVKIMTTASDHSWYSTVPYVNTDTLPNNLRQSHVGLEEITQSNINIKWGEENPVTGWSGTLHATLQYTKTTS